MIPEMQRLIAIDSIPAEGREVTVEATAQECQAVAKRLGVVAVQALSCRMQLALGFGGAIDAQGKLRASLRQICVVTLEEFDSVTTDEFAVRFVPAGTESDDPDPESVDEIPYEGGAIDVGEAATEQLALILDPYPRKPGATLPEEANDPKESPFASLKSLRKH
jgi:hypothetical protein